MFSPDYQYTLFYLNFPPLTQRWEDSFYFENTKQIGTIRLIRAGETVYSILNGKKSNIDTPSWCGDVLVTHTDISVYFSNAPKGNRSCVIWRERHAH